MGPSGMGGGGLWGRMGFQTMDRRRPLSRFMFGAAISVLRVYAAIWSSLRSVASVAAMMSSKGILLGAIAKDNPSVSTSSSSNFRCLWLRFTTNLLVSSVG